MKIIAKTKFSNGDLHIREMELDDLSAVFALGEQIFTADKWPNLYRTWDEYELVESFASEGELSLVAEIQDKVVGFALGTLIEKRRSSWIYGYLEWIGVSPDLKRTGVGTRLFNRLTELMVEKGARMLLVDTQAENLEAINFFKRQGFGQEIKHIYLSRNLKTHPQYVRRKKHSGEGKKTHTLL
ncbi:MAG: GNAT family N-acetyltransferase [bacterium]|nr:MAG: GNAT family N-acetyltransferase [bacterium]